jgi:glycerol-3-phosphate dehydrogenase
MKHAAYDLCVIGGGINGAGVARDAAGRGLSVVLLEAKDLAQGTSSASTKLIHGGLRYLEYFQFKLVRESLMERERLLKIAPHIIWPLRFILPHDKTQRPFWMIRAGLFLYDNLARRDRLKSSQAIDFEVSSYAGPLQKIFQRGVSYADCWVEDSRLVVLNALDAKEHGAEIKTRSRCKNIKRGDGVWQIVYEDAQGQEKTMSARTVVNAAGPWAYQVLEQAGLAAPDVPRLRLVKGSHIIIKRAYEGDHAYVLQQPDKRIVFTIPYEQDYTLIGTTEQAFHGDAYNAMITDDEINYLMKAYNASFQTPITKADVQWAYSGVRPLFDDGSDSATSASRDFRIHVHDEDLPLISIFGGKLTTYRLVAEAAVDQVLAMNKLILSRWTGAKHLPGGGFKEGNFEAFVSQLMARYPWLPRGVAHRYARAYGTRADRFLDGARSVSDLGRDFGDGVYEAELVYLIEHEWAMTAEDILWRRSKLGLHVSETTLAALNAEIPALVKRSAKS